MMQRTWLKTAVCGKGTLSFAWKVSCEPDYSGEHTYDHLTFSTVEGGRTSDLAKIDGETGWLPESVTFKTDGPHVILWTYSADDWEDAGFEDCGWVDNVVWTGGAQPQEARFDANGGKGTMAPLAMEPNKVYKLPKCTLEPPADKKRFAGWACSDGRRYDDEMLVFNLGTVTMTAIWE